MRSTEKEKKRVFEIVNSLISESHLQMVFIHARSMLEVRWLKEQAIT
jgi:hypothetical protein